MSIDEGKILAIRAVRVARNEIREARLNESFSSSTRKQLEELYTILDKVEDDLILSEVDEGLSEIEKSVKKIEDVNSKIKETNQQFDHILKVVDVAARSLNLLIKMTSTATGIV
jgi:predicted  nucleic acid-binding Zn-ribbon protein